MILSNWYGIIILHLWSCLLIIWVNATKAETTKKVIPLINDSFVKTETSYLKSVTSIIIFDCYIPQVGKLFRPEAVLSTFVQHKAAVKINLPISMLYDQVWLWTAVMRSSFGYKLHKIFWLMESRSSSKVQGNHGNCQLPGTWHRELSPLKKDAGNSKGKSI